MSRQNKAKQKRKHRVPHARFNVATNKAEATGKRGGRTKKLHSKLQIYPKTEYLGPCQWRLLR